MKNKTIYLAVSTILGAFSIPSSLQAAGLTASDGAASDYFGCAASQSGSIGLIGAYQDDIGANINQGSAYIFRNLNTTTGTVPEYVKLIAADGAANDRFGTSVSQSGSIGLVGAEVDDVGAQSDQGSAYIFRNLDTALGTITQNVKLTASDGAGGDFFGKAVNLSGTTGVIGAWFDSSGPYKQSHGSAYVFRNLDTATGNVTQNVKLTASDGMTNDVFGGSVSISGNIGLVGAIGVNSNQGSAYVFRNLDTATGIMVQNVKLIAADGLSNDWFGNAVSQFGNIALVGAYAAKIGTNRQQGSAYIFRDLDTATGNVTQNTKLVASDGGIGDNFGISVSLSDSNGLVGAAFDTIGANSWQGSAYIFGNLDTADSTVMEKVKVTASDGIGNDRFGVSVSLSGDQFLIGASGKNSLTGKAYSGSVASLTMLDPGNTSKTISQISFVSQDDWIVGQTTDANSITLSTGDNANVTASGKAVYIGKNAGSDNNVLTLSGNLTASTVNIGSTAGNVGNILSLKTGSTFAASAFRLAPDNFLKIDGNYLNINTLLSYLGSTSLQVWQTSAWTTINTANYSALLTETFSGGLTTISSVTAVPEASTYAMYGVIGMIGAGYFLRRHKGI